MVILCLEDNLGRLNHLLDCFRPHWGYMLWELFCWDFDHR